MLVEADLPIFPGHGSPTPDVPLNEAAPIRLSCPGRRGMLSLEGGNLHRPLCAPSLREEPMKSMLTTLVLGVGLLTAPSLTLPPIPDGVAVCQSDACIQCCLYAGCSWRRRCGCDG